MAKIYRGIVVVHGVGEHTKGSYVSGFVEELAKYLGSLPGYAGKVTMTARNRIDSSDTTWATIDVKNADPTRPDEEWHIREAWWTRTFQADAPGRVYLWAVLAGIALLKAALCQQAYRGLLGAFNRKRLDTWPTEREGRPFLREPSRRLLTESEQGVWLQPEAGLAKSILDGAVWFILTILFLGLGLVGILVIGVVYLVLVLPISFVLPEFATGLLKKLMNLIVYNLGDQEAMTTKQVALASAANEVNSALWNMLSRQALVSRHANDHDFLGFETVTVVAHSGGCVVSMAALKSPDFAVMRAEPLPTGYSRPERINWVTAGSGLNLAWGVRFGGTTSDEALWNDPLEGVNWINFFSRYDPVPQGPPPFDMITDVICVPTAPGQPNAPDPEAEPGGPWPGQPPPRPPFVNIRVANTDSPWGDHGAYWENHEEVLSRIVHVATDPYLAANPLSAERTGLPPTVPSTLAKNLAVLEDELGTRLPAAIHRRRWTVSLRTAGVLAAIIAFFVVSAFIGDDVGKWALGTGELFGMHPWAPGGHQLENVVAEKFGSLGIREGRNWLVGVAVMGFAALVAVDYCKLFWWLWRFSATRPDWKSRAWWLVASGLILVGAYVLLDLLLIRWPTGQLS